MAIKFPSAADAPKNKAEISEKVSENTGFNKNPLENSSFAQIIGNTVALWHAYTSRKK